MAKPARKVKARKAAGRKGERAKARIVKKVLKRKPVKLARKVKRKIVKAVKKKVARKLAKNVKKHIRKVVKKQARESAKKVKKQVVKKMKQKQVVRKEAKAPAVQPEPARLPRVKRGDGKVRACVLYGYGINCDFETQHALEAAGAVGQRVHVNDLLNRQRSLNEFEILVFPGGFSFGDDLGSGKVLANKFKFSLQEDLRQFVKDGMLVAGICNGFQSIVKLGLLPAFGGKFGQQEATLTFNDSGRFEDRWVRLAFDKKSPCVWTKGIERLYLPVRHGEGKFVASEAVLKKMEEKHLAVAKYADGKWKPTMEYPDNPNGSLNSIAAACDETGRVFGIMPHPEAFNHPTNHPRWTRGQAHAEGGLGLKVFENAVKYAREKLI